MELVVERAIRAGLTATFVITLLIYAGRVMGLYMDFPQMLGLFFVRPKYGAAVYTLGLLLHFTIGAFIGLLYAWLFSVFTVPANWFWGGVFGVVHGLLAGTCIGVLSLIHPRIGPEKPLPSPGLFCINYGSMIPLKLGLLHVVYGLVLGFLYTPGVTA